MIKSFGRIGFHMDQAGQSHLWLQYFAKVRLSGWKHTVTTLTPCCISALEFETCCNELIEGIESAKKYARKAYQKR